MLNRPIRNHGCEGQTISEKILSAHNQAGKPSKQRLYAGELAVVNVDGYMASDTTAPLAIKAFREMGGKRVSDPKRFALVIDHAAPAPTEKIGNLHKMMREFAREQGSVLFEGGEGICHQLMVEQGYVKPGDLYIGADSHTPTYGALGAFAAGVGSTDLAAVMLTGKIWLKVPQTIKIEYTGSIPKGITSKDLILHTVGKLSISGATYQAIEYCGDALVPLSLSSRMTMANMSAEMGAKAGIVHPNGLQLPYDWQPVLPDADARYAQHIVIETSHLRPQLSLPGSPDNTQDIDAALGTRIDYAFIGTCVNGRLEDLQAAAALLKGKTIHPNVRLLITPASKQVFIEAMRDGTAEILMNAGASFTSSGCGACVGSHQGVPGDGEVVISSANRNFKGRMGNPNAHVYLAAPTVVAASALKGEIADPAEFL
jgi:3-isopropylmalate/(R)-2-methylmalate dehydratase large subunit